jgi:hypothetical protein
MRTRSRPGKHSVKGVPAGLAGGRMDAVQIAGTSPAEMGKFILRLHRFTTTRTPTRKNMIEQPIADTPPKGWRCGLFLFNHHSLQAVKQKPSQIKGTRQAFDRLLSPLALPLITQQMITLLSCSNGKF